MSIKATSRNLRRAIAGDESARYVLAERLLRRGLPNAYLGAPGKLWVNDTEFVDIYTRYQTQNRRSMERRWQVRELARYTAHLGHATAECGVYTGLTSHLIASTSERPHHGFDSFAGLSQPGENDGAFWSEGDLTASYDAAVDNLASFDNVTLYRGWIPDVLSELDPAVQFSFLHVDVDLEAPTRASLEFFAPRLVPGGVIVLDDHGFDTCPGARVAAQEVASDRGWQIFDSATGQGIIHVN